MKNSYSARLQEMKNRKFDDGIRFASLCFLVALYNIDEDGITDEFYHRLEQEVGGVINGYYKLINEHGSEDAADILLRDVNEIRKLKHMDEWSE